MFNKKLTTVILTTALLATAVPTTAVNASNKFSVYSSNAFLKKASKQAARASKKYGLYPSVMMAQAVVESNWGTSLLATKANNLFGMKANDDWKGKRYNKQTLEWVNGKYKTIIGSFRKYSSYEKSFEDNAKKLRFGVTWQPLRYSKAWIENAKNYQAATKALTGTYATEPHYNTILNTRIKNYKLNAIDPKISTKKYTVTASMSVATYKWPTDHSVSPKKSSIVKGKKYKVTKTITYYNDTQRMYLSGKGWVNSTVIKVAKASSNNETSVNGASKATSQTSQISSKKN
ncbi:MAG: glucosaminidase domain-containing protein [Lactobacillus sp.]|nr:glucosaminidase domain-containing protein [Lactobacillus sp.]